MNIDNGKSHWTEPELATLRSAAREFMSAHGVSQATTARECGVGDSTLSQFLSGSYKGDLHQMAQKVSRWLSSKHEEAALASRAPPTPTFTMTDTAEAVMGVLRSAQALADMGLVTGPPGVGKTAAALQYQATGSRIAYAAASPSISTVSGFLQALIRSRGELARGRSTASKLDLTTKARDLFGLGWLIIADEAQHLETAALEELRAIHDATACGLVLMGNETVLSRIEGKERGAGYAQLFSRAGVRVRLKGSSERDINDVLTVMGVTEPGVVQVALSIGAKDNLRVVVKALRRAIMTAQGARENLNQTHVRLAYRQLGGTLAR
jgi:DNA transposition AAA+ family ATPase